MQVGTVLWFKDKIGVISNTISSYAKLAGENDLLDIWTDIISTIIRLTLTVKAQAPEQ